MREIKIKVYTIEDHPNKEKCFDWIRENWTDLNEHNINDIMNSIEKLSLIIGGKYSYSIGECGNEHIAFYDYDENILNSLDGEKCQLTGVCYDYDIIEGAKTKNFQKVIDLVHKEHEYLYTSEALQELCESMKYEFLESGKFYPSNN